MKTLLLLVTFLTAALSAYSFDEFNTYKWNRKNVIAENGKVDSNPWYEWWYYKVVLPKTNKSFFFVYGIVNPWDQEGKMEGTRSYVGMGDFANKKQVEDKFGIDEFNARYDETYVTVKGNVATDKYLKGSIKGEDGHLYEWDIDIEKKWAFNSTGWATGRMITNIEWYPAQADATCSGTIISAGEKHEFKDAPCYQDRNWGNSFPKWWTWIVSNHFIDHPDTALAIGGGKPTLRGGFDFIESVAIGLRHKGEDYTFRLNDFDHVRIDINFGKWEVLGVSNNVKVEIKAFAPKEKFMDLKFITPDGREFHDYETLTGNLKLKLYKRKFYLGRWELVDELESNHTGIEYGSPDEHDKNPLFTQKKRIF